MRLYVHVHTYRRGWLPGLVMLGGGLVLLLGIFSNLSHTWPALFWLAGFVLLCVGLGKLAARIHS